MITAGTAPTVNPCGPCVVDDEGPLSMYAEGYDVEGRRLCTSMGTEFFYGGPRTDLGGYAVVQSEAAGEPGVVEGSSEAVAKSHLEYPWMRDKKSARRQATPQQQQQLIQTDILLQTAGIAI
jgi:hypothetical protein